MGARRKILKQSDVTSYAKAMRQAGVHKFRILAHPDGTHEIVAGETDRPTLGPDPDELLK